MSTEAGSGSARRRGRHVAGRHKKSPSAWREQRLVVLMGLAGAALALVIGILSTQSNSKPAKSPSARAHRGIADSSRRNRASEITSSSVTVAGTGGAQPVPATSPCAPSDVTITTTTDRQQYRRGQQVTVMTKLVSKSPCVLNLVPKGQFRCGESIVIETSASEQVFPARGQSEQCGSLPHGDLRAGTTDVETIVWDQLRVMSSGRTGRVSAGHYEAVGSWYWKSTNRASPYKVAARSAPFEVLP